MTPFIANVFLSALSTIVITPQVEPDPALIAQLEQERPVAVGKNGADALFALPKVPTVPVLQCQTDSTDCLAKARQNLATYHKEAKQHQKAWQKQEKAIAALLQYGHFRYLTNLDAPPYGHMISERFRATYRFVDREKEAAMQSVCTDAALGLHFINTAHSQILDGIIGASMIGRDVPLLAEMLAESPAGTRLPAACDEVKVQPAENLSLCPRMYGEWRGMSERLQNALQEEELKKNDEKLYKESGIDPSTHIIAASFRQQTLAYALHKVARACTAEAKAAVARGELPDLSASIEAKAQYLLQPIQRHLHRHRRVGLHPLPSAPAQRQPLPYRAGLPTPPHGSPTGRLSHRKQYPDLHPLPDTQKRRRDANRHPAAARQSAEQHGNGAINAGTKNHEKRLAPNLKNTIMRAFT